MPRRAGGTNTFSASGSKPRFREVFRSCARAAGAGTGTAVLRHTQPPELLVSLHLSRAKQTNKQIGKNTKAGFLRDNCFRQLFINEEKQHVNRQRVEL